LLSGGVSAGKFDLVPSVLAELGVERVFHKVSLRPGKPLWFGVKQERDRQVLVFGLPGNPVSSLVCFELFVRPAIAALAGRGFVGLAKITGEISHAFEHAGGRAACLPAQVAFPLCPSVSPDVTFQDPAVWPTKSNAASVKILPWRGSADLAALAHANGLARLPAAEIRLTAGAPVEVLLL
jgi:molybdopterin molybdotransferase